MHNTMPSFFSRSLYSLKTNTAIQNAATCEVHWVINFLNSKNIRPVEIYKQIFKVYAEGAMDGSNMRKWCQFKKKKQDKYARRRRILASVFGHR